MLPTKMTVKGEVTMLTLTTNLSLIIFYRFRLKGVLSYMEIDLSVTKQ